MTSFCRPNHLPTNDIRNDLFQCVFPTKGRMSCGGDVETDISFLVALQIRFQKFPFVIKRDMIIVKQTT